jgi:hypothetical protein
VDVFPPTRPAPFPLAHWPTVPASSLSTRPCSSSALGPAQHASLSSPGCSGSAPPAGTTQPSDHAQPHSPSSKGRPGSAPVAGLVQLPSPGFTGPSSSTLPNAPTQQPGSSSRESPTNSTYYSVAWSSTETLF